MISKNNCFLIIFIAGNQHTCSGSLEFFPVGLFFYALFRSKRHPASIGYWRWIRMNEINITDHISVTVKPTTQKDIDSDINYHKAQKVAEKMLSLGLISLSEFNKLTQINRQTFSPFLVEIMPEIR